MSKIPDPVNSALKRVRQTARAEITRRKCLAKFLAKPVYEHKLELKEDKKGK